MSNPPPEYVAARRVLLDALDALRPHHRSLVLIGAQAVYLHTGEGPYSVPPMTTDADLALDADLLSDRPELAGIMEACHFRSQQPGHWENAQGVAVDLMVAPHQAGTTRAEARAARIPPHEKRAVRIAPGLAPALVDNAQRKIAALDPEDQRSHVIRVAGPGALLVAKTIKIDDRLRDAAQGQPQRVIDKDALDILRLLQTVPTANLSAAMTAHSSGSPAQDDVRRAIEILRVRATNPAGDLPKLATRAAQQDPTVAPSFAVLVAELLVDFPA